MYIKTCTICAKEFSTRDKRPVTCSRTCGYKMRNSGKRVEVNCAVCKKVHFIQLNRLSRYKTCSKKCTGILFTKGNNDKCSKCGKSIKTKNNKLLRQDNRFCSRACMAEWKSVNQYGSHNPNFRNRLYDNDGYRIVWSDTIGRQKAHHVVTFEVLSIDKIPKNYHIHHRDCNHLNNDRNNLALLSISDHQWLHKQFGNATLWAYIKGKVSLSSLVEWSNNKERAQRLLPLDITKQIGVFKSGELLEKPVAVNQQPS